MVPIHIYSEIDGTRSHNQKNNRHHNHRHHQQDYNRPLCRTRRETESPSHHRRHPPASLFQRAGLLQQRIKIAQIYKPLSLPQDLSDCVQKALNSGGSGRYSCDECGKLFKHPGSLQHHRHIHRGTHKCPSCGKVISASKKKITCWDPSLILLHPRLSPAAGTWSGT